ncbi:MAG: hypothetical protein GX930_02370, partial [Clostridia bacterium]|nr:hypothetical protein [Clostridia bacterium]
MFKHTLLTYLQKYEEKLTVSPQDIIKESNSRSDIPVDILIPLWHLILEDKVISYKKHHDYDYDSDYCTLSEYLKGKMTPILIQKLNTFFTPKLTLHSAWHNETNTPFSWELTLESSCAKTVGEILRNQHQASLHLLLPGLSKELNDGMEILGYLDNSSDEKTGFLLNIPSIEEHTQNHTHSCEMQVLVDLIRDSWIACTKVNKELAINIVHEWINSPYYLFQRLALYAASKGGIIDTNLWLGWLLQNHNWRLWEHAFSREVFRLLATQANSLSTNNLNILTNTILTGPPDTYFEKDKFTDEDKLWYSKRYIWLRLAKLIKSDCQLTSTAKNTYALLSEEHPEWELDPDQKEEFSYWICGTGDPDFEAEIEHIFLPRSTTELSKWLKMDTDTKRSSRRCFEPRDDWQDLCQQEPQLVLDALLSIIKQQYWNIPRIGEALETWRNSGHFEQGNLLLRTVIESIPENLCEKLAREIAFYCESAHKNKQLDEELLLFAADRIFSTSYEDSIPEKMNTFEKYDPLNTSLNHAVGMITRTLLNNCFADKIKPNKGIDDKYRIRFEKLCSLSEIKYRHGRFALATRSIALYHVNPAWAKKYLIPLFDWSRDEFEASSAWHGFLRQPAIYKPLLIDLQKSCLEMLSH